MVLVAGETEIEDTRISSVTVTVQQSQYPLPSAAVAMTVALPLEIAVTIPSHTVATLLFELVQFKFLFVALVGQTVADREKLAPFSRDILERFRDTEFTEIVPETVMVQLSETPLPSTAVAVILAVPTELQ